MPHRDPSSDARVPSSLSGLLCELELDVAQLDQVTVVQRPAPQRHTVHERPVIAGKVEQHAAVSSRLNQRVSLAGGPVVKL